MGAMEPHERLRWLRAEIERLLREQRYQEVVPLREEISEIMEAQLAREESLKERRFLELERRLSTVERNLSSLENLIATLFAQVAEHQLRLDGLRRDEKP